MNLEVPLECEYEHRAWEEGIEKELQASAHYYRIGGVKNVRIRKKKSVGELRKKVRFAGVDKEVEDRSKSALGWKRPRSREYILKLETMIRKERMQRIKAERAINRFSSVY